MLIYYFTVISAIKNYFKGHVKPLPPIEKGSAEAYDLWAENYDSQPGNLMIDLDEKVFGGMLTKVDISGKVVADIGCGSGRHWAKIFNAKPQSLTGFDVSDGMLQKLKEKFPQAHVHHIADDLFSTVPDATFDTIISTLTVAHIDDIETAMAAWSRILRPGAEILITDFHPHILALGGKRTFRHQQKSIAVKNYVHPVYRIIEILEGYGFQLVSKKEIEIDESMKQYYESQNAMPVYRKYKGAPVIYGIHLKRSHAAG